MNQHINNQRNNNENFFLLFNIIHNVFKLSTFKEKTILFSPLLLSFPIYRSYKWIETDNIINTLSQINSSIISLISLLLAFSLAMVSLIFASSSKSIEDAKDFIVPNKIDIRGKSVSYFKLIIIRLLYTVILEIIILILSLISLFLFYGMYLKFTICLEIILLANTIIVLLQLIWNFYNLMLREANS